MSSRQRLETHNYYNDPRVQAAFRTKRIVVVEQKHDGWAKVEIDLGEVTETHRVFVKYELCPLCRGRGQIVDPSIDCGGLTSEDFERYPGLYEEYRSSRSTMDCTECDGKRVVIDHAKILEQLPSETQIQLTELEDDDEDFLRVQMAELAFGC